MASTGKARRIHCHCCGSLPAINERLVFSEPAIKGNENQSPQTPSITLHFYRPGSKRVQDGGIDVIDVMLESVLINIDFVHMSRGIVDQVLDFTLDQVT